nr:unnamed protein product [Callosobruchus chinensis]
MEGKQKEEGADFWGRIYIKQKNCNSGSTFETLL